MDPFEQGLSTPRLQPYLSAVGDRRDSAIEIYQLNLQLCASLYPSLHLFEIVFRNQIHSALEKEYQTGQDGRYWYDRPDLLKDLEVNSVEEAKKKTRERFKDPHKVADIDLPPRRIISELSFGFWTSLIASKKYQPKIFNKCVKTIFPYASNRERSFHSITTYLKDSTSRLRNRIFHHEPIWKPRYKVREKHEHLCRLLGWMNPEILAWLQTYDRFPAVYKDMVDRLAQLGALAREKPIEVKRLRHKR